MSASVFVPSGTPDHASGGEMFGPSHVYSAGIMPPSSKAVLVSFRVILSSPFVPFSTPAVAAGGPPAVPPPRGGVAPPPPGRTRVDEGSAVENGFRTTPARPPLFPLPLG